MPQPTSVSRRMESCFKYFLIRDYESALLNFFPALDKTAQRRRRRDGVGKRIRSFIADQEIIITAVATRMIFHNISVDGVTFPDAIYKFGRTAISHDGELDPKLTFNETQSIQIGDIWNLPSSYITGLCVGLMVAPENAHEFIREQFTVTIFGQEFKANELWGAETRIKQLLCDEFRNPRLFLDNHHSNEKGGISV